MGAVVVRGGVAGTQRFDVGCDVRVEGVGHVEDMQSVTLPADLREAVVSTFVTSEGIERAPFGTMRTEADGSQTMLFRERTPLRQALENLNEQFRLANPNISSELVHVDDICSINESEYERRQDYVGGRPVTLRAITDTFFEHLGPVQQTVLGDMQNHKDTLSKFGCALPGIVDLALWVTVARANGLELVSNLFPPDFKGNVYLRADHDQIALMVPTLGHGPIKLVWLAKDEAGPHIFALGQPTDPAR